MDWLVDLLAREDCLKKEIAELSTKTDRLRISSPDSKNVFFCTIKPKIEEIQAAFDDYLCGRNEAERLFMNYKVRLKLPLFSHLRSIYLAGLPGGN